MACLDWSDFRPQPNHSSGTTKITKITKIQSTEYTEQTEKPRRRADDIFKESMKKQDVDHEWCKRLRRLGGCESASRNRKGYREIFEQKNKIIIGSSTEGKIVAWKKGRIREKTGWDIKL